MRTKILAYLGPEGTFTQSAALHHADERTQLEKQPCIADVFQSLETGKAQEGIVPIENSTEGSVREVSSLLLKSNLHIIKEIQLPIQHCLIGKEPLQSIQTIFSKDQAIAQCRQWLAKNMPGVVTLPVESTAAGARLAKETPHAAAIGAESLAPTYGLSIVQKGIQDIQGNTTRFAVLREKPNTEPFQKTTLLLSTANKPGALAAIFNELAKEKINLSRIESHPSLQNPWEYVYFLDFEGSPQNPRVKSALSKVEPHCLQLRILGNYPVTIIP